MPHDDFSVALSGVREAIKSETDPARLREWVIHINKLLDVVEDQLTAIEHKRKNLPH